MNAPGAPPAGARWLDRHRMSIGADVPAGSVISVQATFDKGWRATMDRRPQALFPDGLGMIVVRPDRPGACAIELSWADPEARPARAAFLAGVVILLIWTGRTIQNRNKADHGPPLRSHISTI
jgi:hypothetical protein